jgi:hypothetical protein
MCCGSPKTPAMPVERWAMKAPENGTILTDTRRKVTSNHHTELPIILTVQVVFIQNARIPDLILTNNNIVESQDSIGKEKDLQKAKNKKENDELRKKCKGFAFFPYFVVILLFCFIVVLGYFHDSFKLDFLVIVTVIKSTSGLASKSFDTAAKRSPKKPK